jgi:hypothetical protein
MASVLRAKTDVDQETYLNTKTNRDMTRGGWALVEAKSDPYYDDILCLTASDSGRNTTRRSYVSFVDPAKENDHLLDSLGIGDGNSQLASRRIIRFAEETKD